VFAPLTVNWVVSPVQIRLTLVDALNIGTASTVTLEIAVFDEMHPAQLVPVIE
jgi:hypothetical protein